MTASSAHAPVDAGRPIDMGTRAGRPVAYGLDCFARVLLRNAVQGSTSPKHADCT